MELPPTAKGGGPPLVRILAELGRRALSEEVRERLQRLEREPLGFVARSLGERHRQIQAEGRSWTHDDILAFVEGELPAALEEAERSREGT